MTGVLEKRRVCRDVKAERERNVRAAGAAQWLAGAEKERGSADGWMRAAGAGARLAQRRAVETRRLAAMADEWGGGGGGGDGGKGVEGKERRRQAGWRREQRLLIILGPL